MPDRLRRLAHSSLTFNAPLSEERAGVLVERLPLAPGRHVLDLGCGWAELLLRVVAAHRAATGTGVDSDPHALDRARSLASKRGIQARIELVEGDVLRFEDHGDLVICVGSAHAWGGASAALRALRERVTRGGTLLFGDGFWERPPGADARRLFGELPVWEGLIAIARGAGYAIESAERSTPAEWDAFETGWRSGLDASGDPAALALAQERKREYEELYRGVLGFAWLLLHPSESPPA